ncbi:MAG: hypothetical protein IKJ74_05625 [Clostridia bacterium]|nr:hypothetical protein [Clostridia bacterium]
MAYILGNEPLLTLLFSSLRQNKVAGCYVLEGAEGTGKLTVARYFAAALMCTHPNADCTPCLSCPACKNVLSGGHVDVTELRPEEEGKRIPVSAIRQLIAETHLLPTQGDWRVLIIENADHMNKEAQNALLKSIEEPSPQTVFFLLTDDLTRLLPTVRSRAVKLKTEPLEDRVIRSVLAKESGDFASVEEAVLLCGGSLGKARSILCDKDLHEAREKVISYFKALMDGAGFTKLSLILPPGNMNRADLGRVLPMIKIALRDLITARYSNVKSEFFTDERFRRDLASIISPASALRLFELIQDLERAVAQNVNIFSALSGFHLTAKKLTQSSHL